MERVREGKGMGMGVRQRVGIDLVIREHIGRGSSAIKFIDSFQVRS